MPDQMDLVRSFYAHLNRADTRAMASLYHPRCVVEHVFVDDDGVFEGRDEVAALWGQEFRHYGGALAGGQRVEVSRIAGIETGWGWVRSEWLAALRPAAGGDEVLLAGHSHFWIDAGFIQRHRSAMRRVTRHTTAAGETPRPRDYPTRPIVGVGGVVLVPDGRVVLVKRRFEPLAGQWSLPGGMLELGETLEAGTAREIVEETGLVVDVERVVEVFDRILVDADAKVRFHFVLVDYLCRPRGGALRAGTDVSEAILADPSDLDPYRLTEKAADVIQLAVRAVREGPD